MKFSEKTTATEILEFFNMSVMEMLDELGEMYDGYEHSGMPDRMIAVKTRRKLLAWFEGRGGL